MSIIKKIAFDLLFRSVYTDACGTESRPQVETGYVPRRASRVLSSTAIYSFFRALGRGCRVLHTDDLVIGLYDNAAIVYRAG